MFKVKILKVQVRYVVKKWSHSPDILLLEDNFPLIVKVSFIIVIFFFPSSSIFVVVGFEFPVNLIPRELAHVFSSSSWSHDVSLFLLLLIENESESIGISPDKLRDDWSLGEIFSV